jgi:hypothetical protein
MTKWWYDPIMETGRTKPRKKRTDRNHLVYQLTSPTGQRYIGVTFARKRAYKTSLTLRWEAHCRNANQYNLETCLSKCIREEGAENFKREILNVVRGKDEAHTLERELIASTKPELNMEGMGRKRKSKHT